MKTLSTVIVALGLAANIPLGVAHANVATLVLSGTHDRAWGSYAYGTPVSLSITYDESLPLLFTNGTNSAAWEGTTPSILTAGGDTYTFNKLQIDADAWSFGSYLNLFGTVAGDPSGLQVRVTLSPSNPALVTFDHLTPITNLSSFSASSLTLSNNEGYKVVSDSESLSVTDAPSVPEPATWAMMLAGFGAIGFSLRRRPRVSFVR